MTSVGLVVLRAAEAARGLGLADGGSSPSDVDPTTGKGPEWGEGAPIGLLVIVLLCVAGYFLARSMSKQIKKVPKSFDPADEVDESRAGESAGETVDATGPGASVGAAADGDMATSPPPGTPDGTLNRAESSEQIGTVGGSSRARSRPAGSSPAGSSPAAGTKVGGKRRR